MFKPNISLTDIIEQEDYKYSIQKKEKTASLIDVEKEDESEILIPRSVTYESHEYPITSISKDAFNYMYIKKIDFPDDSQIQKIENNAFTNSTIEILTIPSSVIELEYGWCNETEIGKIIVSPENKRYSSIDEKLILGKQTIEDDEYTNLVFSVRNIEEILIPDFIKIIEPYAFNFSSIKKIIIPSSVQVICKCAFEKCSHIRIFKFQENSMLQKIGESAFAASSIMKFKIPPNVTIIGKFAFVRCIYLRIVEFSENSKIEKIEKGAFSESSIERFTIPSSLTFIDEYAFQNCKKLHTIKISEDSKLTTIKRGVLSCSSIESMIFPRHLTKIDENAFFVCLKLQIIEIVENSDIKSIDQSAFRYCKKLRIMIPVQLVNHIEFVQTKFDIRKIHEFEDNF